MGALWSKTVSGMSQRLVTDVPATIHVRLDTHTSGKLSQNRSLSQLSWDGPQPNQIKCSSNSQESSFLVPLQLSSFPKICSKFISTYLPPSSTTCPFQVKISHVSVRAALLSLPTVPQTLHSLCPGVVVGPPWHCRDLWFIPGRLVPLVSHRLTHTHHAFRAP